MGCNNSLCDHKSCRDDDWSVEITDDASEPITIDDSVIRELMEAKAIECPKGKWCMRGVGKPVSQCSAKANECPLRDKAKPAAKAIDADDPRAAALALGQARSKFYEDQYYRAREQDRQWDAIRRLHANLKPRPQGERRTVDFGPGVPPELRFLTY